MIKQFNDLLALIYLVFVLVWIAGVAALIKLVGISTIEALGLGTATGVLLAILKDVFQFYFRTRPPTDEPVTPTTPPDSPIGH